MKPTKSPDCLISFLFLAGALAILFIDMQVAISGRPIDNFGVILTDIALLISAVIHFLGEQK